MFFFSNAQSNKNKKIECNVWLTLEKQEPSQTEKHSMLMISN